MYAAEIKPRCTLCAPRAFPEVIHLLSGNEWQQLVSSWMLLTAVFQSMIRTWTVGTGRKKTTDLQYKQMDNWFFLLRWYWFLSSLMFLDDFAPRCFGWWLNYLHLFVIYPPSLFSCLNIPMEIPATLVAFFVLCLSIVLAVSTLNREWKTTKEKQIKQYIFMCIKEVYSLDSRH